MNSPHTSLRIIDAAANRASEGLRVIEDYVRFGLDDAFLTRLCKELRHDLQAALAGIPASERLTARETQADVGVPVKTVAEQQRQDARHVTAASFARVEQAVRSLEEFSKTLGGEAAASGLAAKLEQVRYRFYTLEKAVGIVSDSIERLANVKLCVLIDGKRNDGELSALAQSLVAANVGMLQLRDKTADDRALLAQARVLREATRGSETLFIVNDRADIAALACADGVHLGQDDLPVKEARAILSAAIGANAIIGVSTHNIEQARRAVLDGANYLGAGPTFPSGTKQFEQFAGLEYLRQVAAEIKLPTFAIGGIDAANLSQVLQTGITRVAVSGAVMNSSDPAEAAGKLQKVLQTPKK